MAVIICWTSAVIYNLPRFFERVTEFKLTSNDTVPTVARTALRENYYYVVVYKSALFFVARFLLPFSTIAFFNTRLIMAIRASARLQVSDRRGCGELKRRERYTLTLVVVVLVFVICELPDLFLRTWMALQRFLPAMPYPTSELRLINVISNLFLTINSSVNFIIYCVVGRRFRDVLVRVFCSSEPSPSPLRRNQPWPADLRGTPRSTEFTLRHLERSGAENSQITVRVL